MSAGFQAVAHKTAHHVEAVNAFVEKRKPDFLGRLTHSTESPVDSLARSDRARRGTGGRRAPLHCGGRRFAATPLRCSLRGATSQTRPGYRPQTCEVVAEYRSFPAPLRCSAPQRRCARRPPRLCVMRTEHRCTAGSRKAVGGRPAARLCGAEERRAAGVAHRPKAMRRAQHVRAPSTVARRRRVTPVRGRVLRSPPQPEHRRAVAAQRRPPHRSADGRPPTALRARSQRAYEGRTTRREAPAPDAPAPPGAAARRGRSSRGRARAATSSAGAPRRARWRRCRRRCGRS